MGIEHHAVEPLAVKLKWRDTVHLFHGTRRALIELHRASPTPIEQVPVAVAVSPSPGAIVNDPPLRSKTPMALSIDHEPV